MTESYLQLALESFRQQKETAEKALAQVSDDDFFESLAKDDNSLAILVQHMAGNLRSRWRDFLTTDGEKPDRHRDTEFEPGGLQRRELMETWEAGWRHLFDALTPLDDSYLGRKVILRGESLSVLRAVSRQLTHYAYHVGQMVFLARHFAGDSWQTLSVAKGKSEEFNTAFRKKHPEGGR